MSGEAPQQADAPLPGDGVPVRAWEQRLRELDALAAGGASADAEGSPPTEDGAASAADGSALTAGAEALLGEIETALEEL
ncbi:hypothetical protein [Brevibacterium album]|uniref:hypothetical protein n=1 Tax=Brevibacterium album TaxID=417948 RepID=UPI000414F182|nr:hypothetical protein [Brevibacterium album]